MTKKCTKKHEVLYHECDIDQATTFPSTLGVIIKTSEDQDDQLGRGSEFVNSFGLTWAITSCPMEINRPPRVGKVISVTTQAMEYDKFLYYRDFWIYSEDGKELAKTESIFVSVDFVN